MDVEEPSHLITQCPLLRDHREQVFRCESIDPTDFSWTVGQLVQFIKHRSIRNLETFDDDGDLDEDNHFLFWDGINELFTQKRYVREVIGDSGGEAEADRAQATARKRRRSGENLASTSALSKRPRTGTPQPVNWIIPTLQPGDTNNPNPDLVTSNLIPRSRKRQRSDDDQGQPSSKVARPELINGKGHGALPRTGVG